jgi:hypothetical protein
MEKRNGKEVILERSLLIFLGILLILIAIPGAFAIDDLLALQGNVKQGGVDLASGNLTVTIFGSATGTDLVYNSSSDFNNSIVDGKYDVMLGNGSVELRLEYGRTYFIDMVINGEDFDYNGAERQPFQSGIGQINGTFVNPNQINSSHLTFSIDLSNATNIQARTVNKSTGTFFLGFNVSTILDTIYSWNISGSNLFPRDLDFNIGIGTSNPTRKLDVRGEGNFSGTIYILNGTDILTFNSTNNPFNQDLNTTSNVVFRNLSVTNNFTSVFGRFTELFIGSFNQTSFAYNQTVMSNIFNQNLNTTSNVTFRNLTINGNLSVGQVSGPGNRIDFHGGWQNDGFSIIGGDIYARTGFFYNITSLQVNQLNVNGSLVPQIGFDNTFDVGNVSRRWRDLYIAGIGNLSSSLFVGGNSEFIGNVTIRGNLSGGSPLKIASDLNVINTTGGSKFYVNQTSGRVTSLGSLNFTLPANENFSISSRTVNPVFFVDGNISDVGIATSTPGRNIGGTGLNFTGFLAGLETFEIGSGSTISVLIIDSTAPSFIYAESDFDEQDRRLFYSTIGGGIFSHNVLNRAGTNVISNIITMNMTSGTVGVAMGTASDDYANASLQVRGRLTEPLGNVSVDSGSDNVKGSENTNFTTMLRVGDSIKIGDLDSTSPSPETFTIAAIYNDTNLTIDSTASSTFTNVEAWRDYNLFLVENGDRVQKFVITKSGDVIINTRSDDVSVNSTLFFINGSNGFVSIGTANSTQRLDVRGAGNFSGTIYVNNGTDLLATAQSNPFNQDLNTTSNVVFRNLSVTNNFTSVFGRFTELFIGSFNQTSFAYNQTVMSNIFNQNLNTTSNVVFGNITSTGNLTVSGTTNTFNLANTSDNLFIRSGSPTNTITYTTPDAHLSFVSAGIINLSIAGSPDSYSFNVGTTPLMTLLGTGFLGIGTNNPNATLNVLGTSYFNGNVNITGNLSGESPLEILSDLNVINASGASKFYVNLSGNIGVNVTDPAAEFEVVGRIQSRQNNSPINTVNSVFLEAKNGSSVSSDSLLGFGSRLRFGGVGGGPNSTFFVIQGINDTDVAQFSSANLTTKRSGTAFFGRHGLQNLASIYSPLAVAGNASDSNMISIVRNGSWVWNIGFIYGNGAVPAFSIGVPNAGDPTQERDGTNYFVITHNIGNVIVGTNVTTSTQKFKVVGDANITKAITHMIDNIQVTAGTSGTTACSRLDGLGGSTSSWGTTYAYTCRDCIETGGTASTCSSTTNERYCACEITNS